MKVSYYPGCSLDGTAIEYNESLKSVAETLGYRAGRTAGLDLLRFFIGPCYQR